MMINRMRCSFFFMGICVLCLFPQEQKQIHEFISVVNQEVYVRVQRDGKAVGGLKKEDFQILENGKPMEINGFFEKSRRIGLRRVELQDQPDAPVEAKPRLFVLYLWVHEPEVRYAEALDSFFNRIYRFGDRVIIALEEKQLEVTRPEQVETVKKECLRLLDRRTAEFKKQMTFMLKIAGNERSAELTDYWNEFRHKYLIVDYPRMAKFAESLKSVSVEKWILVFYQSESFPRSVWVEKSEDDQIQRDQIKAAEDLKLNLKEVRQAFIGAGATFHLLHLDSAMPEETGKGDSAFFSYDHLDSSWMKLFEHLASVTGGESFKGENLAESLEKAAEAEDMYYVLTYAPKEKSENKREVHVSLSRREMTDCTLNYARKFLVEVPSEVKIIGLKCESGKLEFSLRNYRRVWDGEKLSGNLHMQVRAVDKAGKEIGFDRDMKLPEEATTVSLKLRFPHPGKYKITVTVADRHSKLKAESSLDIKV